MARRFGILRMLKNAKLSANAPFEAGQVWTYKTRADEKKSALIVCKVETDANLGEIVHIFISGVKVKNAKAPGGVSAVISHMPYASKALRGSIVGLETIVPQLPRYDDGYNAWRAAFEVEKAGVWTVPVAEAIASLEASLGADGPVGG